MSIITLIMSAVLAVLPSGGWYDNLPLDIARAAEPQIQDTSVCVADFGAVPDGATLCTEAFAKAIKALQKKGGGHLVVPRGVWVTGPIKLRSGIDLHLEEGSVLVFSPDKTLYLKEDSKRAVSPISADGCTDVSITGSGIIDGCGKYWRYAKRGKMSDVEWKDLCGLGGRLSDDGERWLPYDIKGFPNATSSPDDEESFRPHMISFKRCSRVLVSGVTVQNSPRFHIVPSQCEDVILFGVTVRCPWNVQNGDGIDIGNSRRVAVVGCTVDVGDDGICMKGGSGARGVEAGPCEDILIRHCTVFRAHGGFVIGGDVSGGMHRLVVQDCSFCGTDKGLRFKSSIGKGGPTSEIFISDISMNDIREAAVDFECSYVDGGYKTGSIGPGTAYAPDFGGISIRGVVCRECPVGISAKGVEGLRAVHDVTVSDSDFSCTVCDTSIDEATCTVVLDGVRFHRFYSEP